MKRKTIEMLAALLASAVLAGCIGNAPEGEMKIAKGVNAAVSPDGKMLACQRYENGVAKIYVRDLGSGTEKLVDGGRTDAIHPAWAPDGSLVYSFCQTTATSYQKWQKPKTDAGKGWVLRSWKDGTVKDLTSTGARDFLPTVSPDGRKIYFASTRGAHSTRTLMSSMSQHLEVLDVASGKVELYLPPPKPDNAGQAQCAVSPDGKLLVWAQIDSYWDSWYLMGAKIGDPGNGVALLPNDMVGVSPRWHPDSRTIAFAGYREGDEGWSVYLTDVRFGDLKKICTGDNPSFTPDGKNVVYDRGGVIYRRALTAADMPSREDGGPAPTDLPGERVLLRVDGPARDVTKPLTNEFVFADGDTFFVRVRAHWVFSDAQLQWFARMVYDDVPKGAQAIQLYRDPKGFLSFATRTAADDFTYLQNTAQPLMKSGDYVLTGIKSGDTLYLSLNDEKPLKMRFSQGVMPFCKPVKAMFGTGLGDKASHVVRGEIGVGWPANVPRPVLSRKEAFE